MKAVKFSSFLITELLFGDMDWPPTLKKSTDTNLFLAKEKTI